jgi:hypothetical protein
MLVKEAYGLVRSRKRGNESTFVSPFRTPTKGGNRKYFRFPPFEGFERGETKVLSFPPLSTLHLRVRVFLHNTQGSHTLNSLSTMRSDTP